MRFSWQMVVLLDMSGDFLQVSPFVWQLGMHLAYLGQVSDIYGAGAILHRGPAPQNGLPAISSGAGRHYKTAPAPNFATTCPKNFLDLPHLYGPASSNFSLNPQTATKPPLFVAKSPSGTPNGHKTTPFCGRFVTNPVSGYWPPRATRVWLTKIEVTFSVPLSLWIMEMSYSP